MNQIFSTQDGLCLGFTDDDFADKMLMRVEELLKKDLNDLQMLRKGISGIRKKRLTVLGKVCALSALSEKRHAKLLAKLRQRIAQAWLRYV